MTSDEKKVLAHFRAMDARSKAVFLKFGKAQSEDCPAHVPRRLRVVVSNDSLQPPSSHLADASNFRAVTSLRLLGGGAN